LTGTSRIAVPRIKSAKKRLRQTKVRTARNKATRSTLRNAVKKVRTAPPEQTAEAFKAAEALIDRAGRKNIVHRNTAARTKSKLAKLANAAKAAS
jgi:small subunit ribosomal protein S20